MKKLIFVILTLVAVSCVSDDPCHSSFTVVNNSDKTIYFSDRAYPELGDNPLNGGNNRKVEPHSKKRRSSGPNCGEELFDETGKLYFIIFDEEILQNNTWEEIMENNLYLVRQEYTLEDMNEADWKIVYNE